MRFSKQLQRMAEANEDGVELDYNLKYEVYRAAASDLRDVVGLYRQRFGHSAYNPKVQEALNKDFNRVLAKYAAQLAR
jgi:hypothetical protein